MFGVQEALDRELKEALLIGKECPKCGKTISNVTYSPYNYELIIGHYNSVTACSISNLEALHTHNIRSYHERYEAGGAGGGNGGGAGGSCYAGSFANQPVVGSGYMSAYVPQQHVSSYGNVSSFNYGNYTSGYYPSSGSMPYVEEEEEDPEPLRSIEELPNWRKAELREKLKEYIKEYKYKQEVRHMSNGVKWLLIFFGLAILLNFARILHLFELMITH